MTKIPDINKAFRDFGHIFGHTSVLEFNVLLFLYFFIKILISKRTQNDNLLGIVSRNSISRFRSARENES